MTFHLPKHRTTSVLERKTWVRDRRTTTTIVAPSSSLWPTNKTPIADRANHRVGDPKSILHPHHNACISSSPSSHPSHYSRASRKASHAGNWYTGDQSLDKELEKWLGKVGKTDEPYPIKGCKAIIAPHAGYVYSGPAAAWAYKSIDTTGIKRVFILGPSHHYFVDGCALSGCAKYETPIGELPLDLDTINELKATGNFEWMSQSEDEAEHSIEMHLPYVRKIFAGQDISVVPILVGAISKAKEQLHGSLLAPYLSQPDTFFIISSDFCHWGLRFQYTFYYPEPAPSDSPGIKLSRTTEPSNSYSIHESISRLDHEAMDTLSMPSSTAEKAHSDFASHLAKTKNTICGRHPIGVLLGALSQIEKDTGTHPTLKWVRYEQSSPCHSVRDSSVSYASAYVRF